MKRSSPNTGPSQRQLRVGETIRTALAEILARGNVRDPDLERKIITVTEVKVTPDLKQAIVFVTPLGGAGAEQVLAGLRRVKAHLRGELAHAIRLKFMPDLSFELDTSFERAADIDRLLHTPEVRRDLDARDKED